MPPTHADIVAEMRIKSNVHIVNAVAPGLRVRTNWAELFAHEGIKEMALCVYVRVRGVW